jgi:imidazolonepropionase-like amidohydrolase
MKRSFLASGLLVLLVLAPVAHSQDLSSAVRQYVAVEGAEIALTHVRVVDGTGGPAAEDQTILIRDGRIAEVGDAGSVRVSTDAEVVDLTGHTVIPGLVGLHDHSYYTTRSRSVQMSFTGPRLYLAAGVTTIRTTGSQEPYVEINLKRAIEAGEVPGPRMFVTGPYLTGEEGSMSMAQLDGPEDARRVVKYWAEEGVDWFKAYTWISREELEAAIDEAHKHGVKVTAHLCSVSFREAVAAGIDNIEHGLLTNSDYDSTRELDACSPNLMSSVANLPMDSEAVQATFREMNEAGVAMTSTPVVFEMFVQGRTTMDDRTRAALAPAAAAEVEAAAAQVEEQGAIPEELFQQALRYEYAFFQSGGLLAAGVDPTGYGLALPGYGDQRNYEILLETDFTPEEAIQIISANGAKVLGIYDEVGSIEGGKLADLVVIEGNPLATPSDIRNVRLVFKDGVGYDAAKLTAAIAGQVGIR